MLQSKPMPKSPEDTFGGGKKEKERERLAGQSNLEQFPVWKTLKLGVCKSPEEYRAALEKAGIMIGKDADELLENIPYSQEEIEIDLVLVPVGKLGLDGLVDYMDALERAIKMGFKPCPAEVGLALRLAYADQPRRFNELRLGMQPIRGTGTAINLSFIFVMAGAQNNLWLHAEGPRPLVGGDHGSQLVLMRSRVV